MKGIKEEKKIRRLYGKTLKKRGGRNNSGRRTVGHRGGGFKTRYRIIDFHDSEKSHDRQNVKSVVETVEYDPNRTARISRIKGIDGDWRYVIASNTTEVGGNPPERLQMYKIPLGTLVYNVEMRPGQGAKLVRSAGVSAKIIQKDEKNVVVELPSGVKKTVSGTCFATLGEVSNKSHNLKKLSKAGANRWRGRRPVARKKRSKFRTSRLMKKTRKR